MGFKVRVAERVEKLPKIYIFRELAQLRNELKSQGMDVINLGVGTPDLYPDERIREAVAESVMDPEYSHGYPDDKHPYRALDELAESISEWYSQTRGVYVPKENIVVDFGAKPITHTLPRVFANPGDKIGIQDPKYPAFEAAVLLADAQPVSFECTERTDYLPKITHEEVSELSALILCYPNNPTGATVDLYELYRICKMCRDENVPVIFDAAYIDFCFDNYKAPSALQTGLDNIIEVGSFSKPYSMTGFRLGWAASLNDELIDAYVRVKSQIDSGVCNFIQKAGVRALTDPMVEETRKRQMEVYRERRDVLYEGLRDAGIECIKPIATPYFWCKLPEGYTNSRDFVWELARKTGVVATPGEAFGKYGEKHFRLTIFQPKEKLTDAVERIYDFLQK